MKTPLTFKAVQHDSRPDGLMKASPRHFRCVIRNGRRSMVVWFSQGVAHTTPPTLADVMECIAMDAMGLDNNTQFSEWCREYGYDSDSREAERIYKAVSKQSRKLAALLGHNDFSRYANLQEAN